MSFEAFPFKASEDSSRSAVFLEPARIRCPGGGGNEGANAAFGDSLGDVCWRIKGDRHETRSGDIDIVVAALTGVQREYSVSGDVVSAGEIISEVRRGES